LEYVIVFLLKTNPTQKGDTQMNYIGIDCHISSLDFAVVNEKGTVTKRAKMNTGVKEFYGFCKKHSQAQKNFH
jgi:hypothetical protein